jgi:F-type H+-transporting ATPase subunit a
MKIKKISYTLLLLSSSPLFAAAQSKNISETLFNHVLDSDSLELFPFLPAVKLPFGMTVHLFMLILSAVLIAAVFLRSARKSGLKTKGLTLAVESYIVFVRDDIVYPVMGEKRGEKWLPFFATLFIFLLTVNFLGLIPAFKTATGNITVTSALALLILFLIFIVGFIKLGFKNFFKNLYPTGTILPIGLFVALLEFISTFTKALVLSLRLFANMFAGHLAILSFLVLMFVLSPVMGIVSIPFALFTYGLEIIVALIQALVFTLLSCIFITMASSAEE